MAGAFDKLLAFLTARDIGLLFDLNELSGRDCTQPAPPEPGHGSRPAEWCGEPPAAWDTRPLRALLQRGAPSVPFTLAEVRESRASKGTEAGYGGSRNRYACVARLLAFQTADPKHLDALMPVWSAAARQNSEAAAAALAGAGKRFAHELEGSEEGYQARRAAKGGAGDDRRLSARQLVLHTLCESFICSASCPVA